VEWLVQELVQMVLRHGTTLKRMKMRVSETQKAMQTLDS
jgi:hypothetical protein